MSIKNLTLTELKEKCQELRHFIIEHVAQNGGHLGATLGVIELTIALHKAFSFLGTEQSDKLVWDVGHQAYAHKILTNRKNKFHTIRKHNGLSGFPSIKESKFDDFGTGHSSTSISAILGMAVTSQFSQDESIKNRWHIAVIGDGAFTAGLPFEALNNIQNNIENGIQPNVLIILNDNGMSIDENVGTLKSHFEELSKQKWKKENSENTFAIPSIFEFFGGNFHGSIDGHNLETLLDFFDELKQNTNQNLYTNKVHFLHIKTIKGKGIIENANSELESKYNSWHAPAKFETKTGQLIKSESSTKKSFLKFQDVFGKTITQLAKQNSKIIAVTPAMASGSSLLEMQKEFPNRIFDVGIAEQHAVTFSAGLATQKMTPFCVIYSTFLQRSYDQIIHDVCVQELKVIFCIDRAGLVGADGATHQGVYDIAFLRAIPNLVLAAPMDEIEFQKMLFAAQLEKNKTSFAIRYPRGEGFLVENNDTSKEKLLSINELEESENKIEIGKAKSIKKANNQTQIVILSYGITGNFAKEAIEVLENNQDFQNKIAHYDMRFCKPLDEDILHHILGFENIKNIITIEDGSKIGGFGGAILEFLNKNNYLQRLDKVEILGVPDSIISQATQQEQYNFCGISTESIINIISLYI
ncbi:1-deoxy-D-xylulose-5-phosphate synthase [Bernardetia sp. MNP-M8]|uniref:1-deoxy-D-xylulose-5-phosphate synthase n=1 Tax=Bernardetia sp. MNP-M8 TaxID=3127470 RepID=UPI0030D154E1